MITNTTYTSKKTGITWNVKYEEMDSFESIKALPIGAAGAFCLCNGQLVLCYAHTRNVWEIPGGGREEGESFDDCMVREIKEESNMKVLELYSLGLETYTNAVNDEINYVLRYAAEVEPYGEFIADIADGEITAIKLINPAEYKQYFDWGERSDLMLKRALEYVKKD